MTAEAASRLVAELGPQKAAEQVLNDSPTLEAVAAGVASGRREWVCGYDPFAAVDTPPTRREFEVAVALRERAVTAVQRTELAGAKSACLGAVAQLRATGASQYQP